MTRYDVLVIGAGIAGISVAALLAETRRVLVLERESHPGYHSTGRSAALFSEIYGAEPVRALSRASRAMLFGPPAGFSESPLIKPRGALHIATAAQMAAFEAFAALPDVVPATRRLSPAEATALCPILREDVLEAGLLEPAAADVDVHAVHQGYLKSLRARGGQLLTDHAVGALERRRGLWVAAVGAARYAAPIVVNAAGAWADVVARQAGAAPIGLQPMRRTALLVEPPPGLEIAAWPMVIDIEERFYFKPDAGLLLLSPADEAPVAPCDVQPEELDLAIAIDRVETATTLEVRRIRRSWAGLRSFVADRVPVVGYDPTVEGFFWLAAQGGYGIQTCPALAETACALALGRPIPAALAAAGVAADALAPGRLAGPANGPADQATAGPLTGLI